MAAGLPEETGAGLNNVAVAVGCLSALGGPYREQAFQALRGIADGTPIVR